MEPLATTRKALQWLCILPADENASIREKIIHVACSTGLIVIEISFVASSGAFVWENVSTNLEEALHGVFQITASIGLNYMLISGIVYQRKIAAMFQTLSNLYEESKEVIQF